MTDDGINPIAAEIKNRSRMWYPDRGDAIAARIVGRTPKTNHYVYEVVVEFAHSNERLAVKLYRAGKTGEAGAQRLAAAENANLKSIWGVARAKGFGGIPRPLGDFSEHRAVVSEKLVGIPLQSMIMKAALLPDYAEVGVLQAAAAASGTWLRAMQRVTACPPKPLDGESLQAELESLCDSCRGEGLDDASIEKILSSTRAILARARNPLTNAVVLHEFMPLNVVVQEQGVGFGDYESMKEDGSVYTDPATFLACVEALEKYPFCNHAITTAVQENFLTAYGATEQEREILCVFKMKILLAMFVAGRTVKESPARKKAMWANVMKKFIQMAADRSMQGAA